MEFILVTPFLVGIGLTFFILGGMIFSEIDERSSFYA